MHWIWPPVHVDLMTNGGCTPASRRSPLSAGRSTSVIPAVLRRGFVREHLVVSPVVPVNIIACRTANDGRANAQIADEGGHGNVQDIITEAAAIGPAAGDRAAAEASLDRAGENVSAEDAQTREAGIVGIGAGGGAVPAEPARSGREVHFDEIRDEDSRDVGAVGFRSGAVAAEYDQIEQLRHLRIQRVLLEQRVVQPGTGAAVEVFVSDSYQRLVEERVALAGDLDPAVLVFIVALCQEMHLPPAGGC